MDFFERQDIARRKTGRLIVMFAIAVVMIVCAMNLAAFLILGAAGQYQRSHRPDFRADDASDQIALQDVARRPEPYIGVTLITLGIIACGSMYKIAVLAHGGGPAVAQLMGGRPISTDLNSHPEEKALRNIVEEMSIASGVPVPQIFVMDDEEGINAFAAGFTPADAVVAVTRGCLEKLNRDELQGVIAHEFSHILNGDMRMNLRLIGVLNGILVLGLMGYGLMRSVQYARFSSRRDSKDNSGQIVIVILLAGAALIVIGYVGLFFGRLIQAAVSRQREYLADASAVQFTRNPMGLAGALKKIGQYSAGSSVQNAHALEVAHLFFASGVSGGLSSLLATHPPLEERIRALDPTFDGQFAIGPGATEVLNERSNSTRGEALASMLAGAASARSVPIAAAKMVDRAGTTTPHAVAAATNILASIPPQIMQAAREPFGARAVSFALLLSDDASIQARQLQSLRAAVDGATVDEAMQLARSIAEIDDSARVAIMDLLQPAIRQLSISQLREFAAAAQALIEADGRVTLFEYAMYRQLRRYLTAIDSSKRPNPPAYFSLQPVLSDIVTVLTALAMNGNDSAGAQAAFQAGIARLEMPDQVPAAADYGINAVDASLNRLAEAAPGVKRRIVDAAAHAVAADGVVLPQEAALLRAICAALDIPLPVV